MTPSPSAAVAQAQTSWSQTMSIAALAVTGASATIGLIETVYAYVSSIPLLGINKQLDSAFLYMTFYWLITQLLQIGTSISFLKYIESLI